MLSLRRFVTAVALLLPLLSVNAQESAPQKWEWVGSDSGLLAAHVSAEGNAPDGAVTPRTWLAIRCSTESGGVLTFTYTVEEVSKIGGFDFSRFEGPDAPARHKYLATLSVPFPRRPLATISRNFPVTGAYTGREVFGFQIAATGKNRKPLLRLASRVFERGSTEITFSVLEGSNTSKEIRTTFPGLADSPEVADKLRPCIEKL